MNNSYFKDESVAFALSKILWYLVDRFDIMTVESWPSDAVVLEFNERSSEIDFPKSFGEKFSEKGFWNTLEMPLNTCTM